MTKRGVVNNQRAVDPAKTGPTFPEKRQTVGLQRIGRKEGKRDEEVEEEDEDDYIVGVYIM